MTALVTGGNEIREGFGVEGFESVVIPLSRVKRSSKGEGKKEGRRRQLIMDEIHVSVVVEAIILSDVALYSYYFEGHV